MSVFFAHYTTSHTISMQMSTVRKEDTCYLTCYQRVKRVGQKLKQETLSFIRREGEMLIAHNCSDLSKMLPVSKSKLAYAEK